jgi:NifU-like protein involved in Fe-S cluster formation
MNSTVDSFQKIVVHRYKNLIYRVDHRSSLDTDSPFVEMQGFNRLCGDRITVFSRFAENSTRLNYDAASCAICQVSADIMCECLAYLPIETARKIADQFLKDVTGSLDGNISLKSEVMNPPYPSLVNDLMMIRSLPSRLRCVTLPWETFSSLCKEKVCHSEL